MTMLPAAVERLHHSGYGTVLTLTGGGSALFAELLSVPGGSRFLLDGRIPYSPGAMDDLVGKGTDTAGGYCDESAARRLAVEAFRRAAELLLRPQNAAVAKTVETAANAEIAANAETVDRGERIGRALGFGLTASLASERPKRGDHRIFAAIQTARGEIVCALILRKGGRARSEEERLAAAFGVLILDYWTTRFPPESCAQTEGMSAPTDESAEGGACPIAPLAADDFNAFFAEGLSEAGLVLYPEERVSVRAAVADPGLASLLLGEGGAFRWTGDALTRLERPLAQDTLIFPGSFHPIHRGHCAMARLAEKRLGGTAALEISLSNVDKPPLDYLGLAKRLDLIRRELPGHAVYLTGFPFFRQKGSFFGPVTFLVGADTLRRLADPAYSRDEADFKAVLASLAECRCRFLVFAREEKSTISSLSSLFIPPILRSLCEEVPDSEFIEPISSTFLRTEGEFSF